MRLSVRKTRTWLKMGKVKIFEMENAVSNMTVLLVNQMHCVVAEEPILYIVGRVYIASKELSRLNKRV